jgi:hypothetical protein
MSSWNEANLGAIAESHDLYISPFREDGITYSNSADLAALRASRTSQAERCRLGSQRRD